MSPKYFKKGTKVVVIEPYSWGAKAGHIGTLLDIDYGSSPANYKVSDGGHVVWAKSVEEVTP